MSKPNIPEEVIKNAWHTYIITTGKMPLSLHMPWFEHKTFSLLVKLLPKSPRCRICYMPFDGIGASHKNIPWG